MIVWAVHAGSLLVNTIISMGPSQVSESSSRSPINPFHLFPSLAPEPRSDGKRSGRNPGNPSQAVRCRRSVRLHPSQLPESDPGVERGHPDPDLAAAVQRQPLPDLPPVGVLFRL